MRPSPLFVAVSLALLCSCSPAPTREQAVASETTERDEIRERVDQPLLSPAPTPVEAPALAKAEDKQYTLQAQVTGAIMPSTPPPLLNAMGGTNFDARAVPNTEHYQSFDDNPTQRVAENPVSTFSIDVDTGSYSNVRRMLVAGERPPGFQA